MYIVQFTLIFENKKKNLDIHTFLWDYLFEFNELYL